jgi:hypothetical protein
MKALLVAILLAVGLLTSSCAMFRAVKTERLVTDTSVVLYCNALWPAYHDSIVTIYLPKGYEVEINEGPDFSVAYYQLSSHDSILYMGLAGQYFGMWPMKTETDSGENFVSELTHQTPYGEAVRWKLYRSSEGWSLKTADRLRSWIFAPTRELAMRWLNILDMKRKEPD